MRNTTKTAAIAGHAIAAPLSWLARDSGLTKLGLTPGGGRRELIVDIAVGRGYQLSRKIVDEDHGRTLLAVDKKRGAAGL